MIKASAVYFTYHGGMRSHLYINNSYTLVQVRLFVCVRSWAQMR